MRHWFLFFFSLLSPVLAAHGSRAAVTGSESARLGSQHVPPLPLTSHHISHSVVSFTFFFYTDMFRLQVPFLFMECLPVRAASTPATTVCRIFFFFFSDTVSAHRSHTPFTPLHGNVMGQITGRYRLSRALSAFRFHRLSLVSGYLIFFSAYCHLAASACTKYDAGDIRDRRRI